MKKILLPILLVKGLVSAVNIFDNIQFVRHRLIKISPNKDSSKKKEIDMKNSSFVALVVFLIASIGTLLGAYLYLTKREKELNEYEKLLFSDEFDDANTDTPDTDDFSYEHNEQ